MVGSTLLSRVDARHTERSTPETRKNLGVSSSPQLWISLWMNSNTARG